MKLLEEVGVSNRAYEQMKMLMELNMFIFEKDGGARRHTHWYHEHNLHDNYVDFTKFKEEPSRD